MKKKIAKAVQELEQAIAEILLENHGVEAQSLSEVKESKGIITGKVKAQDGKTYKFALGKDGSELIQ